MSERERWAYEELQPGDVIEEGDEWQSADGRWYPLVLTPTSAQVRDGLRARRPYKISTLLEIGDALANAQKAATQLQDERDEARKALTQMLAQLTNQTEVLTEVRADEKRLFDDLELLRSEYIKLQAERDNALAALKSAQRARDELQLQVDELRADRRDEVTARHVQQVLHRWATELEWSADCFGSATREQVHGVQNTLIAVMQRIESMIDAEGSRADT